MKMDKYLVLLIVFPMVEMVFLHQLGVHVFIFRALRQFSDLSRQERQFIKRCFKQEIRILSVTPVFIYVAKIIMDYLKVAENAPVSAIMFLFITILAFPNSFQNKHERVYMKRLEGVIIQCYLMLSGLLSALFVVIFDTNLMRYLPFPPVGYISLYSTDGLLHPKWFTLSRVLVYILPTSVYIAVLFYLANFCFLCWSRALYYGFAKHFWWSVGRGRRQKDALDYFGDSDVDSG